MSLAITQTRSIVGISARIVNVEVHLSNGLPSFSIVGLPQAAVKESKDRVRSAIINSNFDFPWRRITINLAPADLPKSGCGFDLPIALGILAASGQIPQNKLVDHEFIGELALDGGIRAVNVIIPAIVAAKISKHTIIIPDVNAQEASLIGYTGAFSAETLSQVCSYLRNFTTLNSLPAATFPEDIVNKVDWSDIKGQHNAKYAMEIAACGGTVSY
jgi:magnesium chelatase family protein